MVSFNVLRVNVPSTEYNAIECCRKKEYDLSRYDVFTTVNERLCQKIENHCESLHFLV